eukprot:8909734-Heterocapsa_arctica.AAC.1
MADKARKEAGLNTEIANGRLAMMAIITCVANLELNDVLAIDRLAMMAIMGMFFSNGLTDSAWGHWTLYTGSPLKTDFSKELSVQAPLGHWDPLGFAAHDNEVIASAQAIMAQVKRRRVVELQHGCATMLACVGYI